jgi:hypothetical protein
MFKRRTLFAIGAGASQELNMPMGTQLANTIHDKLNIKVDDWGDNPTGPDKALVRELRFAFPQQDPPNSWYAAARLIHNGILLTHSIDEFLEIHQRDELVQRIGKATIARSIIEAERDSHLFYKNKPYHFALDLLRLENAWHLRFMRKLAQGVNLSSVQTIFDNVAFVVFNYDRCVEYFLLHALQGLFDINAKDAASILDDLSIVHPFGKIGDLSKVSFGGPDGHDPDIIPISHNIQTYTEVAGSEVYNEIQVEVARAECFVFLGFAFHPEAMRLLVPGTPLRKMRPVFATAYGMSNEDAHYVQGQIAA